MNWVQKISQMEKNWMTPEEVLQQIQGSNQIEYFRWVRVNGEYRFADGDYGGIEHKDMVLPSEKAETAAYVKIYSDGLYVEGDSMTLRLGPDRNDQNNISKLLGIPTREPFRW